MKKTNEKTQDRSERHPCYNKDARHQYGRVHLPIAPKCNIQCNYCNRKYDCVNESRPGVSSGILTPHQALYYTDQLLERVEKLSVIGIAGPGDPFANPDETLETLELIHNKYPHLIFCLSTNGLDLAPYVERLKILGVTHVTITINAIDPVIAGKIYKWVRFNKKMYRNEEAGRVIIEQQLHSLELLKNAGITVKINSIIIPGVNDEHIVEVAKKVRSMGADILNAIPLLPVEDTGFENIPQPTHQEAAKVRLEAGKHIELMTHCQRCRADAVGMLGDKNSDEISNLLKKVESMPSKPEENRPYVAVASLEGYLINEHFGRAENFYIYGKKDGRVNYIETRSVSSIKGDNRWNEIADLLGDCHSVLSAGIGKPPLAVLKKKGIKSYVLECVIAEAVENILSGESITHLYKHDIALCTGSGGGCGGGASLSGKKAIMFGEKGKSFEENAL